MHRSRFRTGADFYKPALRAHSAAVPDTGHTETEENTPGWKPIRGCSAFQRGNGEDLRFTECRTDPGSFLVALLAAQEGHAGKTGSGEGRERQPQGGHIAGLGNVGQRHVGIFQIGTGDIRGGSILIGDVGTGDVGGGGILIGDVGAAVIIVVVIITAATAKNSTQLSPSVSNPR